MAVTCFVSIKVFSRAKGGRATRAAAYRAGERIRDERTGEVHDWRDREEVAQAPQKATDDGVAAWKAFRERQPPEKEVDDSIAKWREFRERERLGQDARGASSEGSRGTGGTDRAEDDEDEDQRKKRNRSRDYEFEL
jgi:hypothetical protein